MSLTCPLKNNWLRRMDELQDYTHTHTHTDARRNMSHTAPSGMQKEEMMVRRWFVGSVCKPISDRYLSVSAMVQLELIR